MARAPVVQDIEAVPEADRLDDALHPRMTPILYGHAGPEQMLAEMFASGRMHHGWLLAGPEGIGKATLAYRFARHVLAAPSERDPFGQSLEIAPETIAFRQVRALSHPGLLLIRRPWDVKGKRFSASIPVDEVRRIRSFVTHTAGGGEYRAVIVDTADELNANAANALLKSLEEPPPRTFFRLVTSEPGRLLPTIRSRCRLLDLKPLGDVDLKRAAMKAMEPVDHEPPGASEWVRLLGLSDGSVRRLLQLWSGDGLKMQDRIEKLMDGMPKTDWGLVHALGDELGSVASQQKFEMFFDLLLQTLARMVRSGAGASHAGEGAERRMAARLVTEARLASWAELWETVVREKADAMALNLDRKSLILETFRRIESVARS